MPHGAVDFAFRLRDWWMPPNGAAHGIAIDRLMRWDIAAMTTCFLLANVLLVWLFLRPRREPSAPSTWRVELVPLGLLVVLYIVMAVTAEHLWARERFEGAAPAALHVEVVAQQFQWYFHYPGTDAAYGTSQPQLVNAALGNPIGLDPADQHGSDDIVASELRPAPQSGGRSATALARCHPRLLRARNAVEAERCARRHAARPLHPHSRRHLSHPLLAGMRIGPRTHAGAYARSLAIRL